MSKTKTPWKFTKIGGVTRVDIAGGADIARLKDLDQKLWTVLGCPAAGLEFDAETLRLLDSDNDGRIHALEVIAAADWLCQVMKNPDLLVKPSAEFDPAEFNTETEAGRQLHDTAIEVLGAVGAEKGSIAIDDAAKRLGQLAKAAAGEKSAGDDILPYGEGTAAADEAAARIKPKIDDYFVRCRLAAYDPAGGASLDVPAEQIGKFALKDLPGNLAEIAEYPLFSVGKDCLLPLDKQVNPAWAADFATLKSIVIDKDYPGATALTEAQWNEIEARLEGYRNWKAGVREEEVKFLESQQEEASRVMELSRFLHYYKDFYRFLQNFVTLSDFYSRDESRLADFQAGKLYIDQRCCELCIKVTDLARHGDMAGLSGMYILYCDCTNRVKNEKMTIAAVVTEGSVSAFREGKNGIFYDRAGEDWDATVIKIIENPISVPQAFWTPYRKLGRWVSDKLSAKVAGKEEESMGKLTAGADEAVANPAAAAEKKPAFDIAKFAGIFAAIGMALGLLISALTGLFSGLAKLPWWGIALIFAGVMLLISGPSMISAWLKLRKRDLAPVLNANGWAINSRILVNTTFGSTLTSVAKYPKTKVKDPYRKKTSVWGILFWILLVCGIAAWLIMRYCPCMA